VGWNWVRNGEVLRRLRGLAGRKKRGRNEELVIGLGVDPAEARGVVEKVGAPVDKRHVRRVTQLLQQHPFCVRHRGRHLGRLITEFPSLLRMPIEDLVSLGQYLRETDLTSRSGTVFEVLRRYPPILGLSVENDLKPRVQNLSSRFHWDPPTLAATLRKQPSILAVREEDVNEGVQHLTSGHIGWHITYSKCRDNPAASWLLEAHPGIFYAGVERVLKGTIEELQTRFYAIGDENIGEKLWVYLRRMNTTITPALVTKTPGFRLQLRPTLQTWTVDNPGHRISIDAARFISSQRFGADSNENAFSDDLSHLDMDERSTSAR